MSNNEIIKNIYPLSPMQEGMLFHKLFDMNENVYFEQACFRIIGNLKIELLEKSLNNIIDRYDILRTIFIYENQKIPRQIVLKTRKMKMFFEDISFLINDEKIAFIEKFKKSDKDKGFNLSSEIPIRFSLLKISEKEYVFIFSFHHIILDGWSVQIIFKDLFDIYNSLKEGSYLELPKINPYSNYIKWLEKRDKKEALLYWKEYLLGYNVQAQIPTIFKSAKEKKYINSSVKFIIDKLLVDELKKISQKNKITINTIFQTMWGTLLQRYNNVNDVVFGAVVSGRTDEIDNIENMVGVFINTVPVRINSSKDESFIELAKEVQGSSIESKNYEYLPLAEIQSETTLKQNLINNIMIFENFPVINYDNNLENHKRLEVKYDDTFEQTNYNFNIMVEMTDEILINLNYNSAMYEERDVNMIAGHIKQIIKAVIENPEMKVSQIEILSREERKKVLLEFNDTKSEYPKYKTIQELFEEQVEKTPDNIAVVYENQKLTYKALNEKANSLAGALRKQGIGLGSIVGIMVDRSLEMIIGIMGILKAGGAYLPIDSEYPADRIEYILEDSNASILLTQRNFINNIQFKGILINLEDEELFNENKRNLNIINNSNDLAYVIYTSGSTGQPKGVMIEHRNAVNFIGGVTNNIQMNENESILALTTISFDIFFLEALLPLTKGLKVIVAHSKLKKDANKLSRFISENDIDIIQATPSSIQLLANSNEGLSSLKRVKKVLVGGEALSQSLLEKLKNISQFKIYNMYGPTETTVWSSIKELTTDDSVTIGKPIANTKMYIVDKNNNIQPIGVAGELCIAGYGVARGYLNKRELTEEKFVTNPFELGQRMYRTGDLARWLPEGSIDYLGRIDHQVKIRGFRIELGEIENQLLENEMIKEAAVVSKNDKQGNKYICAYIVCCREMTVLELREYLLERLPNYMMPAYFIMLEKMQLTPNGKINRNALPEPDGEINTGIKYVAPRNEIEEKLVSTWSCVLGLEKIGIDDDFFAIGGHSLKAIQIVSIMHKEMNVEIPIKEIFSNPTIRKIGKYIGKAKDSAYSSIKGVEEKELYKISSAQKRLFALNQVGKKEVNYNIPLAMIIEGNLQSDRVEEVLEKLIARHEAFRTSFELKHGEVFQKIHKEVKFNIEYAEIDGELLDDIIKDFIKPFNLLEVPLFRVKIVKIEEKKHMLMIDMHHIISDATSLGILIKEFIKLYKGEVLEELRIQYKDYAEWQNEVLTSEYMKKQEEYWRKEFEGKIPVLNMQTDYSRPVIQSFEGDSIKFKINKELAESIRRIGKDNGATLYMILLSVYNILLSRYSGQEDIVVGSPIAGRFHADLQDIVGMFANTLAMRNYPKAEKTFKEFLQEVRKNSLSAYENQGYQFDRLVEKLGVRRDLSRSALFDTMFILQNTNMQSLSINNLKFKLYEFNNNVSKFDIILSAVEAQEEIACKLEYCTKLFKRDTMKRIASHFLNILREVAENQEIKISEIEMISKEEKEKLIVDFNNNKNRLSNMYKDVKDFATNLKVYITDKNNNIQPIGVMGKICISAEGLSRENLEKMRLIPENIIENPFEPEKVIYYVGKVGRWLPNGEIDYREVRENYVKIKGIRIEVCKIEEQLLMNKEIKEAAVVGKEDNQGNEELYAYIVCPKEITEIQLKEYLAERLSEYMIPKHFIKVKKMPLLSSGDIDVASLQNLNEEDLNDGVENIAILNKVENALIKIWNEVLKEETIEINDSFFELGGTSLNIAQLIFKIHEKFRIEIDFKKIYEFNTLKKMAEMIKNEITRKDCDDSAFVKIESKVSLLNKYKNKKIFTFPPKSTYGISYKYIADLLGEYSLYAFNYIEDEDKIEKYVNIIKEIQEEGPYILMGYSAGGLLSFEVAKALSRDKNEFSSIIMIDAYPLENNDSVEYDGEFIDKLSDLYVESAEDEGNLEMIKLFQSSFFKDVLTKRMNHYSKYLTSICKEKINTKIYHIRSESYKKEVNDMVYEWNKYTNNEVIKYSGYGKHREMIMKNFAEKNVYIIKEILKDIN